MADKKDYYKILGITDEEKKLQGDDFEKVLKKKYPINEAVCFVGKLTFAFFVDICYNTKSCSVCMLRCLKGRMQL